VEYLPTADERDWLLDELAGLVSRQGHETLVGARILEPDARCFPDRWEPSERGVRVLSRRLLAYAGLGALEVDVQLYDSEAEVTERNAVGQATSWRHEGAAAWFAGIDGDVCLFGADRRQLDAPEGIVGVMAHEVAHAYRTHHGLVVSDRDTEERLTDLTTVYLGFGVLTTNNAYRYRASGGPEGSMTMTTWSHSRAGYLPPQAMAFLLAATMLARRLDAGALARIARLLETNQKAFFKAAIKALDADQLAARLALPDPATWPAPLASAAPRPLTADDDETDSVEIAPAEESAQRDFNRGQPVFRVVRTAARRWGEVGFVLGATAGAVAAWAAGGAAPIAIAGAAAGLVAGTVAGKRQPRDFCSDRACETPLARNDRTCPGCGGDVRGAIAHQDDRLAAEEALEDETDRVKEDPA
jgi:hypothetical protein